MTGSIDGLYKMLNELYNNFVIFEKQLIVELLHVIKFFFFLVIISQMNINYLENDFELIEPIYLCIVWRSRVEVFQS